MITKMQLKKWEALMEAADPRVQDLSGPSPGGAATELGITRQGVHYAIHAGKLDALAVYDGARLSHYTISEASLARYKLELRDRQRAVLQRLIATL